MKGPKDALLQTNIMQLLAGKWLVLVSAGCCVSSGVALGDTRFELFLETFFFSFCSTGGPPWEMKWGGTREARGWGPSSSHRVMVCSASWLRDTTSDTTWVYHTRPVDTKEVLKKGRTINLTGLAGRTSVSSETCVPHQIIHLGPANIHLLQSGLNTAHRHHLCNPSEPFAIFIVADKLYRYLHCQVYSCHYNSGSPKAACTFYVELETRVRVWKTEGQFLKRPFAPSALLFTIYTECDRTIHRTQVSTQKAHKAYEPAM